MEFFVRRLLDARGDDLIAAQIAAELAGNKVSVEHTARFLADRSNFLIAAEAGGAPIGFLTAHRLSRFKDVRRKMFIYEVDVAEPWRGRGVGRRMIESILELSRAEGVDTAFVLTSKSNLAACALYANTGGLAVNRDDVLFEYALT